MTMLAQYDSAMAALAKALASTQVDVVLKSRDDLDHVKLHAKRVRDRQLLADATEFQMRVERWLGVLLQRATEAGQLAGKGRPKTLAETVGGMKPATLEEIGVDRKLSMRAKATAELEDEAFDEIIAGMRTRMASGKAIIVDPVDQAAKFATSEKRRADHAARTTAGGKVEDLGQLAREGRKFKSIGSDPQWKFLTRSALGDGRSANVHYKTEEVDKIKDLPVGELLDDDGAFYMWMVDWCPQDALDLLAHYGLRHVTTAFTWIKTNGEGALDIWSNSTWHMGQGYWTRANPEDCWLATKGNPKRLYADVRQLIIAPVMEHSRKPDAWLERIERLTEGPYLELQARRPRAGWTSWGDELEFTGVAA
jgi:N6-adenosine-specific RNA methylase IME4/nitrogen regulatory protein PII